MAVIIYYDCHGNYHCHRAIQNNYHCHSSIRNNSSFYNSIPEVTVVVTIIVTVVVTVVVTGYTSPDSDTYNSNYL
jgi:hypothetical protein